MKKQLMIALLAGAGVAASIPAVGAPPQRACIKAPSNALEVCAFVRDGQARDTGSHTLVDLASVVQTVCDGFADIGARVAVERSRHVLVQGRTDDLQRALTNLVDNAVKYGGEARVLMEATPRGVRVEVRSG